MAESSYNPLSAIDYVVMTLLILVLIGFGIYHGVKKRPTTTRGFFLADRSVYFIPIALTTLASFTSPISMLGYAGEIYANTAHYLLPGLHSLLTALLISEIFVPVFYGLDITTAYQYLQLRYGLPMRMLGAVCFLLQTIFYVSIVTFAPALVIDTVTTLDLWIVIVTAGVVCTFYTAMGGMRAVIWTDVLLALVIAATTIVVIMSCILETGGLKEAMQINREAGKLDVFNFPFDPTVRATFCSVISATMVARLVLYGTGQTAVQRFLAARSMRDAKLSVWVSIPLTSVISVACSFQGVVLYAFYHTEQESNTTAVLRDEECSVPPPIKYVNAPPNYTSEDQIVMIFINQQFDHIPGYQGLYISCIFAGSLSTISSGLNSMVAVTMEDIWKPLRGWLATRRDKEIEVDDKRDTKISKILTAAFGCLTMGLAFLSLTLGTLVSIIFSVIGVFGAPILGAFAMGMLWKRTVASAVFCGTLVSTSIGVWMIIGSYLNRGSDDPMFVYQISFYWYSGVTLVINVIISVVLSELIRCLHRVPGNDCTVDPALMCTFLRPKHEVEKSKDGDASTVIQQEFESTKL